MDLIYKSDETGATPRSAADKLADFVSVKDFGAVGDGDANDTSAILAAQATGLPVWFPEGTYKYNATIDLGENDCFLADGQVGRWFRPGGTVVLKYVGSTAAFRISAAGVDDHRQNFRLKGFTLDGAGAAPGCHGLLFETDGSNGVGVNGFVLESVHVKNFPGNQVKLSGICYDFVFNRLSTTNPDRTSGDHVLIEQGAGASATSQIRLIDPWLSPQTEGTWAINSHTVDHLMIEGGTIAPYAGGAGASGIRAQGGLCVRGTSVEGLAGKTDTVGIWYETGSSAVIEPGNCIFFGTNVRIGAVGGSEAARGWVINGNVSQYNSGGAGKGDLHITAGGRGGALL